jgi:hypothetical protein
MLPSTLPKKILGGVTLKVQNKTVPQTEKKMVK